MWKRLHPLLLCLGLAGLGARPAASAQPAVRPQLASLTLALEDGRSYSLSPRELADAKGGAIFWNDWAVYNILFPFCLFRGDPGMRPRELVRQWEGLAADGEQPAFLVYSGGRAYYPLNPVEPGAEVRGGAFRRAVVAITVGYADGRSYTLNDLELTDGRSGVLLWSDFAVDHMLVPFYARHTDLPTAPGDVVRLWGSAVRTRRQDSTLAATTQEMPAFLVKPLCIPRYPLADQ